MRAPRGQGPALNAMGQSRQLACPEAALRIPPLPTVLHSIPIVCWCRSAQQQLAPGCACRPTFLAARAGNVINSGHSVRGLRPGAWLAGRRQVWPHRRRFKEVGSPLMASITILARREFGNASARGAASAALAAQLCRLPPLPEPLARLPGCLAGRPRRSSVQPVAPPAHLECGTCWIC